VLAQSQQIDARLDGCDTVTVSGDRHRLRQLLLILTDNAVKYNQPGGCITLALHERDGRAALTVSNTGPGIPAGKLGRVFDRFFRGDASHNKDIEGCGLGLTIAQRIVQSHAGEIHITSEPQGLTSVTVSLPVVAEARVSGGQPIPRREQFLEAVSTRAGK
jgi:signal transduction histidine kinase